MKFISIDLETSGLDREKCQIIEFAAVIDDIGDVENLVPIKNLPKFHRFVTHDEYRGEAYALGMHGDKFKIIGSQKDHPEFKFCKNDFLTLELAQWLEVNGYSRNRGGRISLTAAGKNFGAFDLQFINKLPLFDKHFNISSMILDPGPMYVLAKDSKMPDMDTCAKRAGLADKMEVTHNALNEALMVVELIRAKLLPA